MRRRIAASPDQFADGTEAPQRQRKLGVAGNQRPLRRLRQRRRDLSGARKRVEQDRGCGGAADQARHRRAVGTPDPHADRDAAVETDRPRIAIAIAGAGLERDPVVHAVFRRRRSEQHIADLPGGGLVHQPQRLAIVFGEHDLAQRPCRAEPRQPGIELCQILQGDADAA